MQIIDQPAYRADIDGLRGVAVLAIILFHLDRSVLPGGFIGVDIFFVISGYLITLQILRDLDAGRFSLVEFYRRRIKRIVPAMLVVVCVTVITTQLFFRPNDAERVAESGLWSLFSLGNVYFWLDEDASYFAPSSEEKPLLHLWSLGVEEQFYLIWPVLLMAVVRAVGDRRIMMFMAPFAVISFWLGEARFSHDPSFAYYMLPTRAGELIVGAMAATSVLKYGHRKISPKVVEIAGWGGSVMLFWALAALSEDQVFPGLRAVPPTIGTGLIIVAGHWGRSWPTCWLAYRPLVSLGVISYSAYLWHWPILAYYRYGGFEIRLLEGIILFLSTVLLGWLGHRFIEQPARLSNRSAAQVLVRQFLLPAGAVMLLALASMKLDGYGFRWFSEPFKAKLAAVQKSAQPAYVYSYVCQRRKVTPADLKSEKCLVGPKLSPTVNVLLWGDSNAVHYIGVLGAFAEKEGYRFRNIAIDVCPPILSDPVRFVSSKRVEDCRDSIMHVREMLSKTSTLVVGASWTYYSRHPEFIDTFFRDMKSLAERRMKIIILGRVPVTGSFDRYCWEKALSFPLMRCQVNDWPLSQRIAAINEKLKLFARTNENIEYFAVVNYLCPDGRCSVYDPSGAPLYFDSSHLSMPGSWRLGARIIEIDGVPQPFQRQTLQNAD